MKYLFLTGCLLASAGSAFGQAARPAVLDVNNYRGAVYPSTQLWRGTTSTATALLGDGLEIPKVTTPGQPSRKTGLMAGLWLGGADANGTVYVAAEKYRQGTPPDRGFWSGPISQISATGAPDNAVYDSVWTVTRAEIDQHRAQYTQPGYLAPRAIRAWPGNTPAGGAVERLAPFVDLNANSLYEPALGEYPDVPGDQATFYVCNDQAGMKAPYTLAMGAEVHALTYAYAGSGSNDPLANTLFVRYTIHNRSSRAYQDVYLGHWIDFDLGNWSDDRVATDRARQMMYSYNGDAFDQDTVADLGIYPPPPCLGYGANPPAQAVQLLSDTLAAAVYYTNDFASNGNPTQALHFYNYLRGKITNGDDILYGGNGVSPSNSSTSTGPGTATGGAHPWMYDGDPVAGTGWTEANAGIAPGDRRMLISAGPYNLPAAGSKVFEIAYLFAQGPGTGPAPHLASVTALQQAGSQILARYQAGVLAAPRATEQAATLALAPNPASRTATIHAALPVGTTAATLILRDALGRPVRTVAVRTATTALDLRGLAAGLYHATLTTPDGRALANQRLVVTAGE